VAQVHEFVELMEQKEQEVVNLADAVPVLEIQEESNDVCVVVACVVLLCVPLRILCACCRRCWSTMKNAENICLFCRTMSTFVCCCSVVQ